MASLPQKVDGMQLFQDALADPLFGPSHKQLRWTSTVAMVCGKAANPDFIVLWFRISSV